MATTIIHGIGFPIVRHYKNGGTSYSGYGNGSHEIDHYTTEEPTEEISGKWLNELDFINGSNIEKLFNGEVCNVRATLGTYKEINGKLYPSEYKRKSTRTTEGTLIFISTNNNGNSKIILKK